MSKTLADLFGDSAYFDGDFIGLNYTELLEIAGINPALASNNVTPEAMAALILTALNQTTRQATDENGFTLIDKTQAIVSPNTEPRKSFVTRDDESQLQTRLSFEIYTRDLSDFDPELVVGSSNNSPPGSSQ
ncbi:MAG: hypothetical protein AAGA16_07580 [Cyanobacteria bacterium P01_E01_bin.35]